VQCGPTSARTTPPLIIPIPIPKRKLHEGDVLSMEQVHQLVAHVRDPYKPAVWLLMLAGLRPAELCGLRVCDVDFDKHVIHVHQTVLAVHRYDAEEFGLVIGPPKTSAGDRRIPILGGSVTTWRPLCTPDTQERRGPPSTEASSCF
jgi:integrase